MKIDLSKQMQAVKNSGQTKNTLLKWLVLPLLVLSVSACNVNVSDDASTNDDQAQKSDDKNKNKDDKQKENEDKSSNRKVVAKDKKEKAKEKPPIPVEIAKVNRGNIQKTYRSITTLEADKEAQVVARSTGILQTIFVEEGDAVKKGQLLAQLDIEQLSLEVDRLKATTSKLKKEKERQQSLFDRKLASRDALDRAKYEYKAQQAQLALSQLKLNYASIKAPIDGIVTERQVKAGNLIRENDLVFKIVDLSSLRAVLYLPEGELKNVRTGQPVWLSIDATGGQPVHGSIERIRPAIDSATGTFRVVATVDNPNKSLTTGMFGKVEVVFDEHKNSLLLEQQALITQDNRSHVFVIRDNKAQQTPVKLGFKRDGLVEITEGLKDTDLVVTTGQQILKHDAKVEIVNKEILEVANEETQIPTTKQSAIANLP